MSALLDAEAWLDEQLAAAKAPPTLPPDPLEPTPAEPSLPPETVATLSTPGTSPFLAPDAPSAAEPTFYDAATMQAPEGANRILYPRFNDTTLPLTPRAPVPIDPVAAQQQQIDASFADSRMDADAWLENAIATTPTPRSVKLPNGLSSYGNDFLKTVDTTKLTPEEYLSIQPDVEVVKGMLHNPQYTPTFEEWQDLTAIEKRLVDEGKIKKPGNLEMVGNAVGGLVVLASDFIYNTAIDADGSITRPGETIDRMQQGTWRLAPAETLARSPATMMSAGKLAGATLQYIGQMIEADWNERPQYVVNETGELLASSSQLRLPNAEVLAKEYAARGQTIRPITEQELQKFDYDRFVQRRQTQKLEDDALNNTTAPTEFVTMLLTGRNREERPIQSQAQVASMAADPTTLIPFASAGTRWGVSAFGKKASAKMLGGLEKISGGAVRVNDALFDRFSKTVSDQTGIELSAWQKAGKVAKDIAKGSQIPAIAGAGSAAFGVDPFASAAIASSYIIYNRGLAVLRGLETGSRVGKTILRESADATNGLDQAARLSVAANPAVPAAVREALERPSNFVPLESTPARIAANPAFGPTTRAVAQRLSNPLAVQAVRNSAALAKGAAKGAIANAPFAYMSANAGDEQGAAAAIGSGLLFGTAGAAFERVAGVRDRRYRQAVSDIGRLLVDVELVGGDVNHLVKTRDMQGLADLAAIQGYYRDGFDFVPLNNADYNRNRRANGQKDMVSPNKKGTAGYFVQTVPDGGKPIIYINLDATNRNPLPHEIGHLIMSGGLDNPQKVSARAWVNKTYGPDGIKARGEEYARTLIQARADAAARAEGREPQPIDITPEMLSAEMESLGQDGLVRGDIDTMDWARDEIFSETFATNAETMDWSSIRRGNPATGNFLTFAEGILGAQARGLMAAGVRIDPQTGKPFDTPAKLFKENPVLAADPQVMKQLETYSKNWRSYLLAPEQSKPRGARIAPSGRAQDIANGGLVTNHPNDRGGFENPWQVIDANGAIRNKEQSGLNAEHKLRTEQAGNLFQSKKLASPKDPTVAKKKRADGVVEIFGRRLPQNFFFSNAYGRHIRDFARAFEAAMDSGETMLTSYFAVLTRQDTGALRDKDLGNAIRIDREVMPFRWFVSNQNNILAEVLDITKFRNRFNRAVADADEPIARLFDNKWENIEPTFKKLLDNHRNNLPGESGLGPDAVEKKDVLNALIGINTNENRTRNPYSGRYGKDGAIERFRLDRINDSTPTGRTGYQFDYQKAAGNALPEIPTPLPDLSRDLPTPKGQAMPDALEVEAFHGTPDGGFTEFQDSPNGIFFSNKRDVAEGYTYKRGAWLSKGKNPKVISSKLRMQNPLVIDAMGARYNNIPFPGREYKRTTFGNIPQDAISVEQATKLAFDAGHDGIVIKDVMDGSTSDDKTRSTIYAVRSPAQISPTTPGQAMPDAAPDKGIDIPAGSMTQLYTAAAKSLPKTIPQAKSVPIVRVMVREKLFDAEGKPVLDKKGKQKEGMTPKLRDNTEIKFKPGNFDLPLPNYQLAKSKFSIGNKDFIGEAVKNRDKVVAAIEQVNKATEVITNDPFKFTDPKGYAEIMRDAGVTKNILVPPSGIDMMLKRPKDFIALLDGGFHGPRTVQGTKAAAMAGLDGVVEMRQVIGEKPTEFVTALHHLWGTLSKQLPPLDQEALWMRLVVQPEVIQQIQNSIDGTFKLKKEQWKSIVDKARVATKGEYGKLGNNATSNANSFFLMLKNHNGRWNEVANLYATDSAIDMRSKFNGLGHGATGIKNKVQGFIGLTFGIKGTVLDRWRFVDLYMDPVMQATGAPTHQHYFQYTGDAKRIPEDPIGIYANYGTIENDNPAFSLALYNGIDRAAQAAINASPELKAYLGNHADPGGLHWVTWNAIKNEAVGHSSLDLTKNFLKQFARTGTAQDWLNFANSSKAYVEGQAANGREIIRLSLDNGVFNYSRQ